MSDREIRLRDAEGMATLLATMAEQLAGDRGDRPAPLYLVGIRSRGVPIAERIAEFLSGRVGRQIPVGAIDITLYRDDIGQGDRWPVLRGTEVPFNVEGADVVLVDDVLFTGRTVRAALNAVCDLGRPARVRLAVVVDRGHREIPVQPDVVGLSIPTERREHVYVRVRPIDPVDEIVRVERA